DGVQDVEQVTGAARQPVEPGDHQHVSGLQPLEEPLKLRPIGTVPADLLREHWAATSGDQSLALRVQRLTARADSRVPNHCHDEPPCWKFSGEIFRDRVAPISSPTHTASFRGLSLALDPRPRSPGPPAPV